MKFRRFLLKSRLWWRYCVSKRHYKRLLRKNTAEKRAFEVQLSEQKRFYERKLEIERLKVESLHLAWSDRFLQLQKLLTVSHITHNLDEKVDDALQARDTRPISPEQSLTHDQLNFFLDAKDGFWEAEIANGRSEAEIQRLWDNDYKSLEIARAQTSVF
jgi:hypothetical protein